jgi:hypothetical protein
MRNKNKPKYTENCTSYLVPENASDVDQMNLKEINYDFNEIFFTQKTVLQLYKN